MLKTGSFACCKADFRYAWVCPRCNQVHLSYGVREFREEKGGDCAASEELRAEKIRELTEHTTPIGMKKSRPGVMLSVICIIKTSACEKSTDV